MHKRFLYYSGNLKKKKKHTQYPRYAVKCLETRVAVPLISISCINVAAEMHLGTKHFFCFTCKGSVVSPIFNVIKD